VGNCPFGGAEDHYDSANAARHGFEIAMAKAGWVKLSKEQLQKLVENGEGEEGFQADDYYPQEETEAQKRERSARTAAETIKNEFISRLQDRPYRKPSTEYRKVMDSEKSRFENFVGTLDFRLESADKDLRAFVAGRQEKALEGDIDAGLRYQRDKQDAWVAVQDIYGSFLEGTL